MENASVMDWDGDLRKSFTGQNHLKVILDSIIFIKGRSYSTSKSIFCAALYKPILNKSI